MAAVASISSIILFLAFGTMGVWKVALTDAAAHVADRLDYERTTYRRLGIVEMVAAIAVLAGLTATGSSPWAIINEGAAGVLIVMGVLGLVAQRRAHDAFKTLSPLLGFTALAVLELILRVSM